MDGLAGMTGLAGRSCSSTRRFVEATSRRRFRWCRDGCWTSEESSGSPSQHCPGAAGRGARLPITYSSINSFRGSESAAYFLAAFALRLVLLERGGGVLILACAYEKATCFLVEEERGPKRWGVFVRFDVCEGGTLGAHVARGVKCPTVLDVSHLFVEINAQNPATARGGGGGRRSARRGMSGKNACQPGK